MQTIVHQSMRVKPESRACRAVFQSIFHICAQIFCSTTGGRRSPIGLNRPACSIPKISTISVRFVSCSAQAESSCKGPKTWDHASDYYRRVTDIILAIGRSPDAATVVRWLRRPKLRPPKSLKFLGLRLGFQLRTQEPKDQLVRLMRAVTYLTHHDRNYGLR